MICILFFFFSSRRRHTRFDCDWSSDVCSSDLGPGLELVLAEIRDKALNGKRLGRDEGRWLLTEAPLLEAGRLANEGRVAPVPGKARTVVIGPNPNHTNRCGTHWQFRALLSRPGDPGADP